MTWKISLSGTGIYTAASIRVDQAGVLRAWKEERTMQTFEPEPDVIYAPQAWLSAERVES